MESSSPRAFRSVSSAGNRTVHLGRVPRVILLHIVVRIPGVPILLPEPAMIKLHEPDSALHQAASHQALPAKWLGDLLVQPVQFARGLRFAIHIHRFGSAALHPVRQLVR